MSDEDRTPRSTSSCWEQFELSCQCVGGELVLVENPEVAVVMFPADTPRWVVESEGGSNE